MPSSIIIDRIKIRRSFTPGYRPGMNGSRPLDEGEEFINFADEIRLIGDGKTAWQQLPSYPLHPDETRRVLYLAREPLAGDIQIGTIRCIVNTQTGRCSIYANLDGTILDLLTLGV